MNFRVWDFDLRDVVMKMCVNVCFCGLLCNWNIFWIMVFFNVNVENGRFVRME